MAFNTVDQFLSQLCWEEYGLEGWDMIKAYSENGDIKICLINHHWIKIDKEENKDFWNKFKDVAFKEGEEKHWYWLARDYYE